jgi:hypothetical protein
MRKEKWNAYLAEAINYSDIPEEDRSRFSKFLMGTHRNKTQITEDEPTVSVFTSKKYKPVALKVKPVYTELPDQYKIKQNITGDP